MKRKWITCLSILLIVISIFYQGCTVQPATTLTTDSATQSTTTQSTVIITESTSTQPINTTSQSTNSTIQSTTTQSTSNTTQSSTAQSTNTATQTTTQEPQVDPCDNIYFAKWLGYMGYALYEEMAYFQFTYIDYNKSTALEDNVLSVELLPNNQVITVNDFEFLYGSSEKVFDIKTVNILCNIIKSGDTEINQILFHMQNGKEYIWNIGSIIIEVVDLPQHDYVSLGLRAFVESQLDRYYFVLNNKTKDIINLTSLEYTMPTGLLTYTLTGSKSQTEVSNDEQNTSMDLLQANESRLFTYSLKYTQYGECDFFVLKPFLKYELNDSSYTMPLDFCIYSGYFTEDVINLIMENPYIQS